MATVDYTREQPILDTLQDALDLRLGPGRAKLGHVFRPSSCGDVAELLASADAFRVAVRVGDAPVASGLVIDLSALQAIADVDATSQIVSVEYGVTPLALVAHLAHHGLELPPFWFADPTRPIGQALTEGEAGPLVMAVHACLPDGTELRTPNAPRRASGPSPEALLLGQHNRFALLLGATLRLRSREPALTTWTTTGGAETILDVARAVLAEAHRGLSAMLDLRLGQVRLTVLAPAEFSASAHFADFVRSEARVPVVPSGGVGFRSWSAIRDVLRHGSQLDAVVAPLDIHGGWLRAIAPAPGPEAPWLAEIRRQVDPRGTLSEARSGAEVE